MAQPKTVGRADFDPSKSGQQPRRYEESTDELAALTLDEAITRSHDLIDEVLHQQALDKKDVKAICVLYSGGNDSTVLAHLVRSRCDYAVHINTGIGIEQTRDFVRSTCAAWELPLIEEHPPPGATYDELVLKLGFPGPAGHMLMYTRLKERGLRAVRRRFVRQPRRERIIFLTGMRLFESSRRMRNAEPHRREGSVVWVNPIGHWTNAHMAEYRKRHADVPRNEVSDILHMSGECLCGAFAKPGELEWIAQFFPDTAQRIRDLEAKAKEAGVHCVWGTRPPRKGKKAVANVESDEVADSAVGDLCKTCVTTQEEHEADLSAMVQAMDAMPVSRTP